MDGIGMDGLQWAPKKKNASGNAVHEFRAFQRGDKRQETRGEFHLRAIETRGLALHQFR